MELLQNWKPYDQNASASFFDAEWMFGVGDGFDIVIGNPPYVRMEQIKHLKEALESQYDCYTGRADLYVYFFERAYHLLKSKGILTYISSNKYFRSAYGEKLRNLLTTKTKLLQLIDFGDADVFTAIAYPSIIIAQKEIVNKNQVRTLTWDAAQPIPDFPQVFAANSFKIKQTELKPNGWQLESSTILDLLAKLRKAGSPLGEYINNKIYMGIKTGLNDAFVIDKDTRNKLITEHSSSSEVIKPFLRGRDIKKWFVDSPDLFIIFAKRGFDLEKYPAIKTHLEKYKADLSARATIKTHPWYELQQPQENIWREFENPKIIYPDIYEHQSFTVDKSGFYASNTCYFISTNEIWLCGVLNSQIIEWFYSMISNSIRGGYLRAFSDYMKQIPIPNAGEGDRAAIEKLVGYVLYLTEQLKNIPSHIATLDQSVTDKRMNLYFEQIIDALVMELYLPEELHEHDKYFMRYLFSENLPSLDTIKGDKMQTLRQIFERLFDKEHPIRHNLFLLNTIPVVRIIEGKS